MRCSSLVSNLTASLALLLVCIGCGREASSTKRVASVCEGRPTSVVIHLRNRMLHLCEAGLSAGEHRVAIGKGGTGKRGEGDNKSPIGSYELGSPRASSSFGMFIPIGYPTASQRRDGYTGSAIGIHGPSRTFAWAGWMNTAADWTEGCIAVASDEAINEIAAWVQDKDPRVVYLEDD
jgi:murein L,D-transpeptidase YafK